jgi:hypothetical protein
MKIEISNGELIDKLSILQLKTENFTDPEKIKNVQTEFEALQHSVVELLNFSLDSESYMNLYNCNAELWDIEDQLRRKEQLKEFDEEFIKLARAVYYTNDTRANLKKIINNETNSMFIEEKEYVNYN